MKIKKIKKLAANKYKIEFTNGDSLVTYDQVILKNNILLKSEIDDSLYLEMVKDGEYYSIYSKVIKYITIRLRSEQEIRLYISKYVDDVHIIGQLMEQLKNEGYINDHRYIHAFIEDKVNLTNYGPNRIRKELNNLGMDNQEVEAILANYDDNVFLEKAQKLIEKRVRMNHKDSMYMLKQKIEHDLLDLGYNPEMIGELLENIAIDESTILIKEIDKIYKKLQLKYSDNELYYQLKQRLYKKGFSKDAINHVLEEYFSK